ncbi:MAG: AMP-binding protein [Burkholderiales bacterium]|nr:AMP-binding protein [Burkholderiales bacterium]
MNLSHLLLRSARAYPELPAVAVGTSTVHTYARLADRTQRLADGLRRHFSLEPGDHVALVMRNCPQYVELAFAAWHGGFVTVPINAKLHVREFQYVISHSGARVCFVTGDLFEAIAGLRDELPELQALVCVEDAAYEALLGDAGSEPTDRHPDDLAWLFYTSGTTGRPKGAMLTHRNLLAMTTSYFVDVDRISSGDAILHAAPMSHGSGAYMLPNVAAGAAQVIPASGHFDPPEIYELIRAWPGMSFFAAPTMVKRLVEMPGAAQQDVRNLRTIVYGGGPMYLADCKQALRVLGPRLAQIYGQGECPMTITALAGHWYTQTDHPRHDARLASVGIAHSVVEVRVADDEDLALPTGETGEVLVRGETMMRGYWHDEAATQAALRNGWLHTGDVGTLDEDGFLTLKDRSKDLIISGGSNIYPREVEEVLLRHDAVVEASVVGAPHPEWGEEVVAFVVARAGSQPPPQELDALCLNHIARFKRPKRYVFVDSLPKNNYGKVLKTALRERLCQADA